MTDAELVDLIEERFYTTAGHARPWAEGYPPTRDRCMARARMMLPLVRAQQAAALRAQALEIRRSDAALPDLSPSVIARALDHQADRLEGAS